MIGRVSFLEVGTYRLDRPLAGFSQAEIGAYSRADIAGTIGGSTLRRFKVVFDYKQGRLILEPNAQYADPPEEYNMSGLLLRARGSGWREIFVDRVQPDSPAAEAGIRAGDILVAMEGKPIDCELSEVGARLKQAGARRAVTILRDGRRQEFQLTLRRLL
ncbi:MAG: PDZ domain-containing protein [Acidobacteriia bacterium]|nr:PDZ domain-containing protein [Terriglobia bacterium]